MRITHCIFSFNTGGAETMLIDIVNQQVLKDEVTLIIINKSYQEDLLNQLDKKVKVEKVERTPGSRSILKLITFNRILHKSRPDIIHVHNPGIIPLIKMPQKHIFWTAHRLQLPLKYVNDRVTIFAISKTVKDDIIQRKQCDVVTVPNGISVEKISKREHVGLNEDDKMKIVQVARLDTETKGQDILIDAIAILKKRGLFTISVDFIGCGESETVLKKKVEDSNLCDQVHFIGLQNRRKIYAHLKDYDLMCHPARFEGFGLTVAEAMAAKLPVLVSDKGGPFEIIRQGELGTAFKSEDVVDCANKVEYIFNHYDQVQNKVDKACQYVAENYSVAKMVSNYRNQYLQHIKIK